MFLGGVRMGGDSCRGGGVGGEREDAVWLLQWCLTYMVATVFQLDCGPSFSSLGERIWIGTLVVL